MADLLTKKQREVRPEWMAHPPFHFNEKEVIIIERSRIRYLTPCHDIQGSSTWPILSTLNRYQIFLLPPIQNLLGRMSAVSPQRTPQELKKERSEVDNKCVCQICTCKKHHCPPRHVEFKADTTNHQFYKPYNVSVERPHKCAYTLNKNQYDPDLLQSTYRTNYKGQQCEPTHYQSRYAYHPNTSKFYDETQYKKSYVPNPIEVQKPVHCCKQYRPNSGKFDGSTTYNVEYKGKTTEQNQIRKHYAYQSNNLPFNGHTTYGDSFKRYEVEVGRPRTCCQGQQTGSTGRFQGRSSYKDQFKGLQNPNCCRCLIEELPPRPRECSPGKQHLQFCAQECNWK